MEDIMYPHIQRIESHNWWYVGRRKIIFDRILPLLLQYKSPRILDVGCGTGYNIQRLKQHGYTHIVGLDISPHALSYCQARSVTKIVCGDGTLLPFPDKLFDMILAWDSIECVQDDLTSLKEQARILKPGGTLVIFATAYEFLWSFNDDMNHHVHRYKIDDLQYKVQQAGLTISKLTYANTFLFPLVLAGRMIMRVMGRPKYVTSEHDLHPVWSNAFLKYIFATESSLLNHVDFPFGVSLLCIAKK
jgi:SAM-dependent methyltransferase